MAEYLAAPRYRWVILGLILMCQTTLAFGSLALGPLAPLFQPELGLTRAEVGLFASATSVGAWCFMLIAGSLTDRFSIRAMVSSGQAARGLLLISMAAVGSTLHAVVVLFLVGIGNGIAMPGPTKAIREWFPPAFRATAMGLKQTGTPIAGILAASVLPAIGLAFGWRMALAVVGVVTLFGGVATVLLYRDPPWRGLAGPGKASMRANLLVVLRTRALWIVGSIGFLFTLIQFAMFTYFALYFKEVVLVDSVPDEPTRIIAAGGYLALAQVGGLGARIFWGIISDRLFPSRRLTVLGIVGALSVLATSGLAALEPGVPPWLLSGIAIMVGASVIGWNGVYHTLVAETAHQRHAATAVGLSLTIMETGIIVGPLLFGLVVDASASYRAGWLLLDGLAVGATLLAFLSRGVERQNAQRVQA